jgi:nitronate monooxygenase
MRAQKQAILASDGEDTLRDTIVDAACGLSWPHDITARVLRNRFTDEWLGRHDELRAVVADAARESGNPFAFVMALDEDPERALNWAGESSGQVREIAPAADVLASVVRDAEELLRRVPAVLA